MRFLSVKNYERFQHYKDRTPPWIKLYNEVLEDYEFCVLPDEQKAHLILIWLLASRTDNKLPYDAEWIGNRIGATARIDIAALVAAGFLIDHSPEAAVGKREEWPSRYISDAVRAEVFERDGGKCRACGSTDQLEYDHVVPVSKGGEGAADNIQLLCRSCNRKKRNRLVGSAEQLATQMRSPEAEQSRSRADEEKEAEPPRAEGDVENVISEIIRCANRGMIDNPALSHARPILASGPCRQVVADWLEAGIPADTCKKVVYERAKAFKPTDRNRQVSSLKYFTAAVRDAWEGRQSERVTIPAGSPATQIRRELPQSNAPRSPGLQSPTGERVKTQDEIEQERTDVWAREHKEAATTLWQECVNEVAEIPGSRLFGPASAEAMVRARFRRRVIDEHLTPRAVA